jgi:hypothetical protein
MACCQACADKQKASYTNLKDYAKANNGLTDNFINPDWAKQLSNNTHVPDALRQRAEIYATLAGKHS